MASLRFSVSLVVALLGFITSSEAYKFFVGGKDGWVLHPSESYNHWAERNRFQVNDTLFFKYENGSDSVLVVNKDEYSSCNTKNPILTLKDGESMFKFDRSGPFYFISGVADKCQKGQKLIIVVLAVRHKHPQAPSPSHCPVAPPPNPALPPLVPAPETDGPSGSTDNSGVPESGGPAPAPAPAKNSAWRGFSFSVGIKALLLCTLVGLF